MASQLYGSSLFLRSSIKAQNVKRFVNSSRCKNSRINMSILSPVWSCATTMDRVSKELADSPLHLMASAMAMTHEYNTLPIVNKRIDELKEKTRECLMASSDPITTMKLIDTIQRLGVGYYFEQAINEILEKLSQCLLDDNLYTVALRFRLQRHNGHHADPDVFLKFMDSNGKFKKSLSEDIEGLLSLYEASYLGANGEDILTYAQEYATTHLKLSISQQLSPKFGEKVLQGLKTPRHMRMERLEAIRYIEEYSKEDGHDRFVLELAKLDYNHVQTLFQRELIEINWWWKQLGLVKNLSFLRDRHVECFLWTVGLLPEPKYSSSRILLAKNIAIMLVIDDIYDTYGSYDELILFTKAIQRWDLSEIEQLPEYMKVCYMALYNTNNEICDKVFKERGLSVQPFLRNSWIEMVEGYMVEVEWVKKGTVPNLKDYIKNGVTTSGTYMALVHLFFLISEGVTQENMKNLCVPYPKVFTMAGTILRLWDDLGTAKEEQERGDILSTIPLLMKERNITCEKDGRNQILQLIHGLWKDLNVELIKPDALLLPIIRVALNTSRASQVVYQHNEDSYLSSVENKVQSLFFKPIEI